MLRRSFPLLCRPSFLRQSQLSVGLISAQFPSLPLDKDEEAHPSWQRAPFTSAFHICNRGFSASGADNSTGPAKLDEAKDILKRIDAAHFREVLTQEAKKRWNMNYDELHRLCQDSGAANTPEAATEVCDALDKAGVILRIKNLVYLRPLQVAEVLYQALPDTEKEIRARLEHLRNEAAPLLLQKQKIDSHAHRVSKAALWGGLVLFTSQVILYFRLTFWELSWDVMEPVAYFSSAAFGVLAYAYYLVNNEEFGYQAARSRIHSSIQNKKYAEKGLNKERLDYLLDRIIRLEQTLAPADGTPPRHYPTYEDSNSKMNIPELARPPDSVVV